MDAIPVIFEKAFVKGTTGKFNRFTLNLYGISIGKIKIESGHIIACDPLHIDEYGIPFTQLFPTGEFPVQLSIAQLDNEEMIAFARINFSDAPVEKWAFALQKDQKPIPVGGEEMYGFGTDSGVGIFLDEAAAKEPGNEKAASMNADLFKAMEKQYHNGWRAVTYTFGNHNLAAFSTGASDGYYATYIGFDAGGKPCRLVSDFGIVNWKKK